MVSRFAFGLSQQTKSTPDSISADVKATLARGDRAWQSPASLWCAGPARPPLRAPAGPTLVGFNFSEFLLDLPTAGSCVCFGRGSLAFKTKTAGAEEFDRMADHWQLRCPMSSRC